MSWASGLRVLIVNDEPELTAALSKEFAEMGFAIEVAIDGFAAARCLLARLPDLTCVNLNLPRDSGYDVCERIRSNQCFAGVPIIVMSDRHSPEEIAYAEEAGANAFLRLPFSPKHFKSSVAALFDEPVSSDGALRELRPSEPPPSR